MKCLAGFYTPSVTCVCVVKILQGFLCGLYFSPHKGLFVAAYTEQLKHTCSTFLFLFFFYKLGYCMCFSF